MSYLPEEYSSVIQQMYLNLKVKDIPNGFQDASRRQGSESPGA